MKRPVFAANWKMNHGPTDARAFMKTFLSHYQRRTDRTVVIFPSALALHVVAEAVRDRPDVKVGVQNIHAEDKGAFTGENSNAMARDAGAKVVLVGHSERRHVFGETNEDAGRKCAAAARAGLVPMLCVGETIAQRESGATEAVVVEQLRTGLAGLDATQVANAVIAYEPVWAIGTGRTATPADASTVHVKLRAALRELVGERATTVPILYGGSVTRGNAALLMADEQIDGLLVGGASLDADNWTSIVRA
jgi:triosephosphate isomerase